MSSKIGILSDIHGNYNALKAVINKAKQIVMIGLSIQWLVIFRANFLYIYLEKNKILILKLVVW